MNNNSRGSEWGKWDLHVHTPCTKLSDNYQEKWDLFCEKIETSDVSVFGITDYFSVENYYIFLDKFKTKYPNSKKKFFPNIELRLEVGVNKANEEVNIHIIFSDEILKEKIIDFLSKLKTNITINNRAIYCNQLSTTNDFEKAGIIYQNIKTTLREVFGSDDCYLIFAAANNQGLRSDNGSPRKMNICDEIDKICDGFIGGSQNLEYYLKEDRYEKNNDGSQDMAKVCPVISGSDSHSLEDIENKLGKKFIKKDDKDNICDSSEITWIKADTTFEGLKQIIYEPEDRVRIQDEKPEQKSADKIIDKVQFESNDTKSDFTKKEIFLSQNLTVIIGGKSTGKSILLKKIAQTVDSEEVAKKTKDIAKPSVDDIKFKVLWKDGRENHHERKIIYIPQSYLNRLADEKNDDEIIKIVRNTLEQEDLIKSIFNNVKIKQDENQTEINKNINALFTQKANIAKIREDIKIIGVKSTIQEAIQKLEKEIADEKLKTSDITDDDFKKYQELLGLRDTLNKNRIQYANDKKILEDIKKAELFKYPEYSNLSSDIKNSIDEYVTKIKTNYLIEWGRDIDLEIVKVEKLNTENEANIITNNENLKPLQDKVEKAKTLNDKIKLLAVEQEKLTKITDNEQKLKIGEESFNILRDKIVNLHIGFFDLLTSSTENISKQTTIKKENGLEFDVSIEFHNKNFIDKFINPFCDGRKIGNHKLHDYQFSSIDQYKKDFQDWIDELLGNDNTFPLKQNAGKLDVIKILSNNWFELRYHITHKGDKITEMSPGKRSFVLLKLLIELDNTNKCPILLDQPEDDLDSRSIFNELAEFIKNKKKERQIIITTHNPNLVIGTDAECVIVANQHGEATKNIENIKFDYIQGAIENNIKQKSDFVLNKYSIQEHICDILEGGEIAFEKRKKKYNF